MFGRLNILNIIYNYISHGCCHFWSPSLPAEHYYLVSWVWSVVQEPSAVQTPSWAFHVLSRTDWSLSKWLRLGAPFFC